VLRSLIPDCLICVFPFSAIPFFALVLNLLILRRLLAQKEEPICCFILTVPFSYFRHLLHRTLPRFCIHPISFPEVFPKFVLHVRLKDIILGLNINRFPFSHYRLLFIELFPDFPSYRLVFLLK
ncbi:hypothetical protein Gotur_001291, partial [Gossypium turneri]